MGALWKIVKNYRSQLVLILTPLILLPLALKEDIIENVKCNPSCDNCQKLNGTDVNDLFIFPGDNEGTPYKIVEKQVKYRVFRFEPPPCGRPGGQWGSKPW